MDLSLEDRYAIYAHECRKEGRVPLTWEAWREFQRALDHSTEKGPPSGGFYI